MFCAAFLVSAALWTVVHADGHTFLTRNFGEDVTLIIPGAAQLHGEYEIIWSHFQKVLIHYDNGEWKKKATERYLLDEKTGSLTVRSLIANDGGRYQLQIFNGNKRTGNIFILTVVGAPSKYPPTSAYDASQSSPSADHHPADPDRNPPTGPPQLIWIAAVLVVLVLIGCVVLAIKYRERIIGTFRVRFRPCKPEDPENL